MPSPNRKRSSGGGALGGDRGDQIVGGYLRPPLAVEQIVAGQAEDVGGVGDQPVGDERLDMDRAQPLDIERVARGEMAQAFDPLGRADQAAGAAIIDLALLARRGRSAGGAFGGEGVGGPILVAGEVFDHLRDHVAGALDADAVAGAHAQPLDLVGIVQRRVADDDAADADRLQPSDGRELAGAADLDVDGEQAGLRLLRREFVRQPPARRARDEAQPRLPVQPIDLVDHAVDVEGQIGARLLDLAILRQRGVRSARNGPADR